MVIGPIPSFDQEWSQRIGRLTRLTAVPATNLMVSATHIQPTLESGRLLQTPEIEDSAATGITGTGVKTVYTVGRDSVEYIYGWDIERDSGDRTFDAIYFYAANGIDFLRLDTFTATARDSRLLTNTLIMRPQWTIRINVTGGSADSNWDVRLLKMCERAWLD
jgi:hypothetical protein